MEEQTQRSHADHRRDYYDVVIVGSGIAGLYTALNVDSSLAVLLASKEDLLMGNTSLAQGGIAAVLQTDPDSVDTHVEDTLVAGGHQNNRAAVTVMAEEAKQDIEQLLAYGVEFDQLEAGVGDGADGQPWHMTLEGGHSFPRILHYRDATGKEMATKLLAEAKRQNNVTLLEHHMVAEVTPTTEREGFAVTLLQIDGASGEPRSVRRVQAGYCVLATGGIGRVYQYTTNAKPATGDGILLAHQLGAEIQDLDAIQFHPTGFAKERAPQRDPNERDAADTFLISEAVRGEGAFLYNVAGERFLTRYDERGELAPRDVVSRSMILEEKRTGNNVFHLDITHKDPVRVREHFPIIDEKLRSCGIDMTADLIPVYPCQHYVMGGIGVDLQAQTSVDRLYAVGECACTGVHGNNRLASNSLLESVVFARHAAEAINQRIASEGRQANTAGDVHGGSEGDGCSVPADGPCVSPEIRQAVQALMQKAYFVFPDWEQVEQGLRQVRRFQAELEAGNYRLDRNYLESCSVVTVAELVLQSLLSNRRKAERENGSNGHEN